ncbi:MAG: sugar phosphate nucleotidyltransferase [Kofleriaceae bacterium]
MTRPPIGLVPAAGRGTRFQAGHIKELYPLVLGDARPRPVLELTLGAIAATGAERCVVVISPEKAEIVRALGDGSEAADGRPMSIAYVVQAVPRGLPDVVRLARPWLDGESVLLSLPDTVLLPRDAAAQVDAHRRTTGADLVLGVFPVDEPERLGPVELDPAGRVVRIFDKPGPTPLRNSWGLASWSPAFTAFCCAWEAERAGPAERPIGEAFEAARAAGLRVEAVPFPDGKMLDIGTPAGLRAALDTLAQR